MPLQARRAWGKLLSDEQNGELEGGGGRAPRASRQVRTINSNNANSSASLEQSLKKKTLSQMVEDESLAFKIKIYPKPLLRRSTSDLEAI